MASIFTNQVAFELKGVKKAVITTSQDASVTEVRLVNRINGCSTCLEALSTPAFTEWGNDNVYFKVDFSRVEITGTYQLKATLEDGSGITSSEFEIADNAVFATTMKDVFSYFHANRHTDERDKAIPIIDTGKIVDVFGGWNDAGGDPGKYLSHLFYSNYFTPQQASFVAWSMLASYESPERLFQNIEIDKDVLEEAFWGCDYLYRILDEQGFFYATVFDRWGRDRNRYVTAYKGIEGEYTPNYQAAFRQGGGFAIAALARAATLSKTVGKKGQYSSEQYLAAAIRAYDHLKSNNISYCDDGRENIIDDYCALMAAIELFRATSQAQYLEDAGNRADALISRFSEHGYFISDHDNRPYFHAVEAGLPLISLVHYCQVETSVQRIEAVSDVLASAWRHQFKLDSEVTNPFDYPRQQFRTFDAANSVYTSEVLNGFFIPHENETGYWWQGENARLASLAAAALLSRSLFQQSGDERLRKLVPSLEAFAQDQIDWILGKNPYDLCMLYGFGQNNPKYSESGGAMIKGGISNGITGSKDNLQGRGIDFAAGDEDNNWRWVEQWTPHGAWFIYAVSLQASGRDK